jgi:hypothetical protein
MRTRETIKSLKPKALAAVIMGAIAAYQPGWSAGIQVIRPDIVVYITENPRLTPRRPNWPEKVVTPELSKHGYKVIPSLLVRDMAALCPRDVRGVWNEDRRRSFLKHFGQADVLWMAHVEYQIDRTAPRGTIRGTLSVVARASRTDDGQSLWYRTIKEHPFEGATLDAAARQALGELMPGLVDEFQRAPAVRQWVPSRRPDPWPRDVPLITAPPSATGTSGPPSAALSDRAQPGPYTGVIVEADHLRVYPSYRSGLYSERGRAVYIPRERRLTWADSRTSARRVVGPRPLRLKALRSEGNRIVLRESDVRRLSRESQLMRKGRVTVVVQPPRR